MSFQGAFERTRLRIETSCYTVSAARHN